MLTVFLSVRSTIFIKWLPPTERFISEPQAVQDRQCILTMPYLLGEPELKIVVKAVSSVLLGNVPITLMSVYVTSFYSVI
jgi:hypothetical protein